MTAAINIIVYFVTSLAVGAGVVGGSVLGACAAGGAGCWWWRRRRGRR